MAKAKYQVVADEIRRRIAAKVYPPKTLIPDQNTLAKEFGVSRMTIKKALDGLAREALIYKQSGLGTYVLGNLPLPKEPDDAPVSAIDGLTAQQGAGRVTSVVIDFRVTFPDAFLQKTLDLGPEAPVYEIRRLRKIAGAAMVLEHTFFPVALVPGLTKEILKGSIYDYIKNQLHLTFGGAYRRLNAKTADDLDQKYLKAKSGDAMLEVEQIIWLTTGQTIEYSTSRNLGSKRSYTVLEINDQ